MELSKNLLIWHYLYICSPLLNDSSMLIQLLHGISSSPLFDYSSIEIYYFSLCIISRLMYMSANTLSAISLLR
jgi:hypothetical protein